MQYRSDLVITMNTRFLRPLTAIACTRLLLQHVPPLYCMSYRLQWKSSVTINRGPPFSPYSTAFLRGIEPFVCCVVVIFDILPTRCFAQQQYHTLSCSSADHDFVLLFIYMYCLKQFVCIWKSAASANSLQWDYPFYLKKATNVYYFEVYQYYHILSTAAQPGHSSRKPLSMSLVLYVEYRIHIRVRLQWYMFVMHWCW